MLVLGQFAGFRKKYDLCIWKQKICFEHYLVLITKTM